MKPLLDDIFAFHCAPTFMGIKSANLISLTNNKKSYLESEFENYNKYMNRKGIYFRKLFCCEKQTLVLVYHKKLLKNQLCQPDEKKFLQNYGYPDTNIDNMLLRLSERISCDDCFPHEIGIFLGYPIDDVRGFIEHNGENYLICGYWKVYSDLERSRKLFNQYTYCRINFCCKIRNGFSIEQLCLS